MGLICSELSFFFFALSHVTDDDTACTWTGHSVGIRCSPTHVAIHLQWLCCHPAELLIQSHRVLIASSMYSGWLQDCIWFVVFMHIFEKKPNRILASLHSEYWILMNPLSLYKCSESIKCVIYYVDTVRWRPRLSFLCVTYSITLSVRLQVPASRARGTCLQIVLQVQQPQRGCYNLCTHDEINEMLLLIFGFCGSIALTPVLPSWLGQGHWVIRKTHKVKQLLTSCDQEASQRQMFRKQIRVFSF